MSDLPPHDLQAEEGLLGAMLLSIDACHAATQFVGPQDFYSPAHQHIFSACSDLFSQGIKLDAVTVAAELNQQGLLASAGGAQVLVSMMANCPATSNAAKYAKIIIRASEYRQLIGECHEMASRAMSAAEDPDELMDELSARLEEIRSVSPLELPDGLWTVDDFLNRPDVERPPWASPGLLRLGWRAMVVAGEGVGKTVLFRNIAICAAQGIHPFTHERAPRINSLIVDLENPDEQIVDVCKPIVEQSRKAVGSNYDEQSAWLWHQPGGIDLRKRNDRSRLEAVIAHTRPQLVAIGPLYKMYSVGGRENDELAAGEVIRILDDLRTRYGFALIMEHHAPKKQGQSKRDLTPYGSSLWLRWPEIGILLDPIDDDVARLRLGRWRGDRVINSWPKEIHRSKPWPWAGVWPSGAFGAGSSNHPPVEGDDALDEEPF